MAGLPAPTVELWGGSKAAEKESSEPEVALEQQKKKKKKRQVFMEGKKDDGTELCVVLYRHISATGLPAPMTGKCTVAWSSIETGHYWIGLGWPASNMEPQRPLPALFALLGDGERRAVCDGEVGNMEEWRCECMLERDELEMQWR